ncbi:zinc transporter ZIP13 isoform X2 [Hippocampus zosterae]|uniref:zinc transporter ZIP13 isoform X2 n=1 Tax=Hippocampus zosterae TaxID=109293 RepID=UPI00223D39E6|nr:zinc transporter ZIP13 isoform X2 [Hippocampus zosterae]
MGQMKVEHGWRPTWAVSALLIIVTLLMLPFEVASGRKISQTTMAHATDTAAGSGPNFTDDLQGLQALADFLASEHAHVWVLSLVGSVVVGLSGIFPLLVIPIEAGAALKTEAGHQKLKRLLSFAIGGLLGDVFLHLLPEAWALSGSSATREKHYMTQGLWVITGLLTFLLLEKMFSDQDGHKDPPSHSDLNFNSTTSGYLNLLANCIDNFTHGLAVAGSFLVSKKVGFLTTFAILLHEIPHEVGDFAILLRAGFDRWSAARLQLSTALVGVLGACFALCSQSPKGTENATSWILPFTSGGFLYIALVNVVPDLLEESSLRHSLQQTLLIICGVAVMAFLSTVSV